LILFIYYPNDGLVNILIKFAAYMKLGSMESILVDKSGIQNALHNLDKQSEE